MTRMGKDGRLNYYQLSAKQTITELQSHSYGLTNPEAKRRLQQNGSNALPYTPPRTPLQDVLSQMNSWSFGVLLIGLGLCLWYQEDGLTLAFALIIMMVLVVGAWREQHVGNLAHNLNGLLPHKATVRRNGVDNVIAAEDLVVGDLLILEPRTQVAADVRLLEASRLLTDDSILHGGHALVHKFVHKLTSKTPLAQHHNMAFAGTNVVSGSGVGIITATGAQTELGRILSLAQVTTPKQSLFQRRLNAQATKIWFVVLLLAVGFGAIALFADVPQNLGQLFALSLSATLVPIGAYISVSILFRANINRSGLRFRAPSALDRLGKIDVALIDDFDFLIRPEPLARQLLIGKKTYAITGEGYSPDGTLYSQTKKPVSKKALQELGLFFEAAILSSTAKLLPPDGDQPNWHVVGSNNDGALVSLATKAGYQAETVRAQHQLIQHFPYDHARALGSTVYEYDHRLMAFVHGDASSVLNQVTKMWDGGHTRTYTAADKQRLTSYIAEQTALGNHVVALAYRTVAGKNSTAKLKAIDVEKELILLGLVAIGWPIKLEAPEAIQTLTHDSVAISLFSHHTPAVASAIARQVGLTKTTVVDTIELSKLDDAQLFETLAKGGLIICHATSNDRLRLVDVMQRSGQSVLVTGRSLSHIPAMHHAAVSLVSSAAHPFIRDEADVTIRQGNIHALSRGLNRSQHVITNIANMLQGAFTDGLAATLLVVIGVGLYLAWHIPVALSPAMILALFVLLQPFLATALSIDRLTARVATHSMDSMGSRVFLSLIAALLGITSFLLFFARAGLSPSYIDSNSVIYGQAATTVLTSLALFGWINLLFVRANHTKTLRSKRLWQNRTVFWALGFSLVLLANAIYNPALQQLLGTEPLTSGDWLSISALTLLYTAIRWIVRSERKHTRQAIVALHHEVHGSASKAQV